MKKNYRIRFITFCIISVLVILNFSTIAFAKEKECEKLVSVNKLENGKTRTIYEFEVTPEEVDKDGIATYAIDSSFTMSGNYYRGADRKYDGDYLDYTMIITSSSSNATNNQVSIQLWDYNHNYSLHTNIVRADGTAVTQFGVPIVSNRTYYFKYYLASGNTAKLKIRMIIDSWS